MISRVQFLSQSNAKLKKTWITYQYERWSLQQTYVKILRTQKASLAYKRTLKKRNETTLDVDAIIKQDIKLQEIIRQLT